MHYRIKLQYKPLQHGDHAKAYCCNWIKVGSPAEVRVGNRCGDSLQPGWSMAWELMLQEQAPVVGDAPVSVSEGASGCSEAVLGGAVQAPRVYWVIIA